MQAVDYDRRSNYKNVATTNLMLFYDYETACKLVFYFTRIKDTYIFQYF